MKSSALKSPWLNACSSAAIKANDANAVAPADWASAATPMPTVTT
jgi:hypothetical protein